MNYVSYKKSAKKVHRKMRWNLEMCKKREKLQQKKVWQAVLVAGACLGWEYRKCKRKVKKSEAKREQEMNKDMKHMHKCSSCC